MNTPDKKTKDKILSTATTLFATHGYEGVSLRTLAKSIPISQSVIYHYYDTKDALLLDMYIQANATLGILRAQLPQPKSAIEMLRQRIEFQFDHAYLIIAVLKYYLHFRDSFLERESGTLPEKAILHIVEVLEYGKLTGQFKIDNVNQEAKVIAHSINGYILEYFPLAITGAEKKKVVDALVQFCAKSLCSPIYHTSLSQHSTSMSKKSWINNIKKKVFMKNSPKPFVFGTAVIVSAGILLSACSPQTEQTTPSTPTTQEPVMMDTTQPEAVESSLQNIYETAEATGSFSTLLAAVEAAGLTETLKTAELTILAPTDEAFAKLPAGTVESLLKDPEALADILKYHVIAGRVPASEVVKLSSAETLQGSDVSITVQAGTVMINSATVVTPDVMASNGVIHVIDTVLLPQ